MSPLLSQCVPTARRLSSLSGAYVTIRHAGLTHVPPYAPRSRPEFAGTRAVLSPAFSPAPAGGPAAVPPANAAGTGHLRATVTQPGRLIGAASFGTLFLGGPHAPGAHASGKALWTCALAPTAASILGAAPGLGRRAR
ncbi:hypothetical protein GPZ77_11345 [Streptomyces sp. QHH-9511]|uniref:hypothetical protein n=1 Tax=Streptomyces sp. QHH-9511 TaxID=2684468 RepID=UPI001317078E|nr:hypothetical protein [Streptomyces sp. QHH-9511]QGZ48897.1 hypothetical protein GPZ77_11345 [Streptomyces sp. QHH-9511]